MALADWYFNQKGIKIFLGLVILNLIIAWIIRTLLVTEEVFYNTFNEQLTYERSLKLFANMEKFSWFSYAFYPFMLLIKVSVVSFVIYLGFFLTDNSEQVGLSSLFKVVLASEIVFILANLCKFLWFYFVEKDFNLFDIQFFYPLSIINFFRRSEVVRIWIYPLQTVNIFHLFYILLIPVGISKVCLIRNAISEKIMLLTYIPAVVIWQALIMFFLIGQEV